MYFRLCLRFGNKVIIIIIKIWLTGITYCACMCYCVRLAYFPRFGPKYREYGAPCSNFGIKDGISWFQWDQGSRGFGNFGITLTSNINITCYI